jgi:hypothetical protein
MFSLPILHSDVVFAVTWHFDPNLVFQAAENILPAAQLTFRTPLFQKAIQLLRIVLAFLRQPATGSRYRTAPRWVRWVGQTVLKVLKFLPCLEAWTIRRVEIRSKSLTGLQLDVCHNPVQFDSIVFRVLHPEPAKVVLWHTGGDHFFKVVSST